MIVRPPRGPHVDLPEVGVATAGEVLIGDDGWLFWVGRPGSNYGRRGYGRWDGWNWRRVARWLLRLEVRAARCRRLGAGYVQLIAPDKLSVYADRARGQRHDPRCGMAARLARFSPRVLDLRCRLIAARAAGETYLRDDTHWTAHGYLVAYAALCARLRASPAAHVIAAEHAPGEWIGDLAAALPRPRAETVSELVFIPRARRREANALVSLREALHGPAWSPGLMVGSRIVWVNDDPAADARRVLLFGDSYSFHRHGLAPLLAETFREVHALWSAPMDWGYVERVRPDVVVHETAERFTLYPEPDGVDVEAIAAARVTAHASPASPSASA